MLNSLSRLSPLKLEASRSLESLLTGSLNVVVPPPVSALTRNGIGRQARMYSITTFGQKVPVLLVVTTAMQRRCVQGCTALCTAITLTSFLIRDILHTFVGSRRVRTLWNVSEKQVTL